jgi:hypothetical protein
MDEKIIREQLLALLDARNAHDIRRNIKDG